MRISDWSSDVCSSDLRPALAAALDYIREGDTLIVTKLDRLARSVADLVAITEALRDKGVGLRVLSLNLDTATPTGKLMLNLLGSKHGRASCREQVCQYV